MDGGRSGLTGQHARESVEQETRRERGLVPTQHRLTMDATVVERILQLEHVTRTPAKVCNSKSEVDEATFEYL